MTTQLSSKSCWILLLFNSNLPKPRCKEFKEITTCAKGVPTLRNTVESVKSRCKREIGSFADKNSKKAFAIAKFPSAFSKSIGLTLCGIAEDPISPALIFCLKYPIEMYCQISLDKSIKIVSKRFKPSK